MRAASNILHLGVKELRSLARDPFMLGLIVYAFTLAIYSGATALPETLNRAPIAIVDEDRSPLSARIADAFYPPHFIRPALITPAEMDSRMDAGLGHLCSQYSAKLPARRAGRPDAGDSAER
jgi:ABC-2 type transport system permease protein